MNFFRKDQGISDTEIQMRKIRSTVFQHMLITRGWKYRIFLRYLRVFKYISFAPTRGKFLEYYYTLMRYLDDVVDGDAPMPEGYTSETEYIKEKIHFAKHPVYPKDEIDHLILFCFRLAESFHENFQEETQDILGSLLFDANRKGKMIIFPSKILMQHFHVLDIRGTIKATLKIFKEDPAKYTLLEPLGTACRYQYDLEDLVTDMQAGYVNIPEEDCKTFDIHIQDMHNLSSAKIKAWCRYRASEGMKLLAEHRKLLPEGNFSLLSRATFPLVYEHPARRLFKEVLDTDKYFNKILLQQEKQLHDYA